MRSDEFVDERAAQFKGRRNPNEIEQSKDNGQVIKVMRTRKAAANELIAMPWDPSPLPHVVLEMIFSSLSTENILSCRLVCQRWKFTATLELRRRVSKFLTISSPVKGRPRTRVQSGCRHPMDNFVKFMQIMVKSQLLPIVSFHLEFQNFQKQEHSGGIEGFFRLFGPIIQNLTFEYLKLKEDDNINCLVSTRKWPIDIRKYLGQIQLEKLKKLEFIFSSESRPYPCFRQEDHVKIMCDFIAAAANVKEIRFAGPNISDVFQSLKSPSPPVYLSTLKLEIILVMQRQLEDFEGINLKKVSLKFHNMYITLTTSVMKAFLQKLSPTLEYLKLFSYIVNSQPNRTPGSEFVYDFPRMEKLKVLSIHQSYRESFRVAPIIWPQVFPKLEELKMRGEINSECLESIITPKGRGQVHSGLKIIDFPSRFHSICNPILSKIAAIFPNIQVMRFPFFHFQNCDTHEIWPLLPRLKKIVLHMLMDQICEERDVEEILKFKIAFLKDIARNIILDNQGKEFFCERLQELGMEVMISDFGTGFEFVRKTYDCSWFLGLLRERAKLEQVVANASGGETKDDKIEDKPENMD